MTRLQRSLMVAAGLGLALLVGGCSTTSNMETFRSQFFELRPNPGSPHPEIGDLRMRSMKWKHAWQCGAFGGCRTEFQGSLFVFDERNGRQQRWNRIEIYPKEDCNASEEDRRDYRTLADADTITVGWEGEREGKFDRVSAFLVFYADWGSVKARVRTLPCP